MYISIKNEGFTISSWSVYSSSVERLVIPRIGECVCFRGVYYIVQDIIYYTEDFTGTPPKTVCIFVKKKNDEKDKKSSQYE